MVKRVKATKKKQPRKRTPPPRGGFGQPGSPNFLRDLLGGPDLDKVAHVAALAVGWAVVEDGEININTVCVSRRGAIVNWLMVRPGVPMFSYHTDADIEKHWDRYRNDSVQVQQIAMAVLPADGIYRVKGPPEPP